MRPGESAVAGNVPASASAGESAPTLSGDVDDIGPLNPLAEVVEGYAGLADWLTREIGGQARAVAARLAAGEYTPDSAAGDAAKSVALGAASWFRIMSEALDAVVLLARPPKPKIVTLEARLLEPFSVPCALELEGPLRASFASPVLIEERRITLDPPRLDAKRVDFRVRVDATRRPGLIYRGSVKAKPDDPKIEPQIVNLLVVVG